MPGAALLGALLGAVLNRFNVEPLPASHLVRPMLIAAAVAVVAGGLSAVSRRSWLAVVVGLLVVPSQWVLLGGLVATAVVVAVRLRIPNFDPSRIVVMAAGVFFVIGLVVAVPRLEFGHDPVVEVGGPPVYVVLLDAYPRADSLRQVGIDISPFVDELEERGFDYYPTAESLHGWTHLTLLAATTGEVLPDNVLDESGAIRDRLRLPDGFVTIGPAHGSVSIPGALDIGGGLTMFEIDLLREAVAGRLFGNAVMDGLRDRLDHSLDLLASTEHRRVFAHISSPHLPYLYGMDGKPLPPPCWPCNLSWGLPVVPEHLGGTIQYLNERVVEAVDAIVARRPDAVIVLVSDHGGRFEDDPDEWHRVFLAARTPRRPGFFATVPRSDKMFDVVRDAVTISAKQ